DFRSKLFGQPQNTTCLDDLAGLFFVCALRGYDINDPKKYLVEGPHYQPCPHKVRQYSDSFEDQISNKKFKPDIITSPMCDPNSDCNPNEVKKQGNQLQWTR